MRRHPPSQSLVPAVARRVPWFRKRVLEWFPSNSRDFPWREPGRTSYEILVAEIMLQRTQAGTVDRMYTPFLERFSSWSSLADADVDEIRPFIEPLGLWRVRASTLLRVAVAMVKSGETLEPQPDLGHIKGIGQYTANAARLILRGEDVPLLDANMARVLERYFGPRTRLDIRDDPYLHALAQRVVRGRCALQLNWAILDLAARVCKPRNPNCSACPLSEKCQHANVIR
jgi:A/G-specific adenine glycosylase